MEEIKTTTDNFARPVNPVKSFEAKYVNNQIVESLVLADIYDKYPIQASTFRKYLFEDTTSNTAQMVIGYVKSITKGDFVIADVEINAKFADKFNELQNMERDIEPYKIDAEYLFSQPTFNVSGQTTIISNLFNTLMLFCRNSNS